MQSWFQWLLYVGDGNATWNYYYNHNKKVKCELNNTKKSAIYAYYDKKTKINVSEFILTPKKLFSRPINDIDLPELPDFLRPESTSKRPLRPIQDIDLPDGTGVIQPDEQEEEEAEEEEQNQNEEEGNM